MRPITPSPTTSATPNTDDDLYASVVIAPRTGGIDDDGAYGVERSKPQFVIDDDKNFGGG